MTIVDDKGLELTTSSNSCPSPSSSFSVDLFVEWNKHKVFLESLHKLGITTLYLDESHVGGVVRACDGQIFSRYGARIRGNDLAFLDESLRRYSQLWLPLLAEAREQHIRDVIPPPDIAWLWHCHRLAPYRYSQHVRNRFSKNSQNDRTSLEGVLGASHPFVFQLPTDAQQTWNNNSSNDTWSLSDRDGSYSEIAQRTRELFAKLYPGESFFADLESSSPGRIAAATASYPGRRTNKRLLSGFDVIAACQRQATFLWQVSGPKFSDESFVRDEGIANYWRFVKLSNQRRNSSRSCWLVPTYQIDCLWHTHILANLQGYHEDVLRITGGAILDHDDSINDRTEGGVLDTSFQETLQLWNDVYGLQYVVEGGMYRGEPPAEFYSKDFVGSSNYNYGVSNTNAQNLDGRYGDSATAFSRTNLMPIDDDRAFIPYNKEFEPSCTRSIESQVTENNPFKNGYVFGRGGKGLGYYHIDTHEAKGVVCNRCTRRIGVLGDYMMFNVVGNIGIHGLFLTSFFDMQGFGDAYFDVLISTNKSLLAWFLISLYVLICFVVLPILFVRHWRERNCLEKIIQETNRRVVHHWKEINRGEASGQNYVLYEENNNGKAPGGAAACGFNSNMYRYELRRDMRRHYYGGACGAGSFDSDGVWVGTDIGGGGFGFDIGGAACGGGGCGGGCGG